MFLQMWHGSVWGNLILKQAAPSPLWTGLSGNGHSPAVLTAAGPVCTGCGVPVEDSKLQCFCRGSVVSLEVCVRNFMSTAMKRPLHANTHIYHSLVKVSLKLQGGFYCRRPSACQNLSLLSLLRNSSAYCDSFAIQFTFTKSIYHLCAAATVGSKRGRQATSCCSAGLLKNKYFGMPQGAKKKKKKVRTMRR